MIAGAVCVVGNLGIVYGWIVCRRRSSLVAFLGGGLAALGLSLLDQWREWWWVPLAVDPGSLLLLLMFAAVGVRAIYRRLSKRNGDDAR